MISEKVKLEKKTQAKNLSAIFVDNLSGIKKLNLPMFLIFTTIAQSVTFSSMFSNPFFVKHKFELFKCDICENLFKTTDYLVSHGTMIHNRIFKNNNTLNKHNISSQ